MLRKGLREILLCMGVAQGTIVEHVIRRGGRYHYRRRVPADLIEAYGGKKEIQRALNTADPKEAARLSRKVAVEIDELFEGLRAKLANPEAPQASKQWPALSQGEADNWEEISYEARHPTESEDEEHDRFMDAKAERERRLADIEEVVRRITSRTAPQPVQQAPAPIPATHVPESSAKPATSLSSLVPIWIKARSPGKAAVASMHAAISRFEEVAGKHPVRYYKRPHVSEFLSDQQDKGSAPATIRTRIGLLRALFAIAHEQNPPLIDVNPCQGIKTPLGNTAKTARLPFERADILAIMSSPVFAKGDRPQGGGGAASYWLPLLAMYTGCRMEELGQLSPKDIKHDHYQDREDKEQPVSVIYITEDGENQGLKNYASRRRIPVHNDLVKLGFLEYVSSQKGARLFPLLRADSNGRETARFSAWFGKYLREKCNVNEPRKTFHSFRHLFIDTMREVGVEEATSQALTGHTSGDISRNYGGAFHPLRPLVEAMAKYKLPGVKLPG
jgi:integrase